MSSTAPNKVSKKHFEMFTLYLDGKTCAEIAAIYKTTRQAVSKVSIKNDWRGKLEAYHCRAYEQSINVGAKRTGAETMLLLSDWVHKIIQRIKNGGDATLEEIKEVQKIFAKLAEENRLTDNKPTQISTGEVRHVVLLPPGVKRFGVDPPGPGVVEIETTAEDIETKKEKQQNEYDEIGE